MGSFLHFQKKSSNLRNNGFHVYDAVVLDFGCHTSLHCMEHCCFYVVPSFSHLRKSCTTHFRYVGKGRVLYCEV